MKDQRGVVYLETLVAFLPVFLFFLATLQIADLSAAHIIVRHAATVAARAAVVVMPDDGRYYNDADNELVHRFEGLRKDDIEHAADRILRANPRLERGSSNVQVGFRNGQPQPTNPGADPFKGMSRAQLLEAAFHAQTAGSALDTANKGNGEQGMREQLDALVTARYRCMISYFCPRDYTMVATASLVYQGARYIYEAWPDSIRSDGRPGASPNAPVAPPTLSNGNGNGNSPANPGGPTNPPTGPIAGLPPGSQTPPGSPGTGPVSGGPNPGPLASNTPGAPTRPGAGNQPSANGSNNTPGPSPSTSDGAVAGNTQGSNANASNSSSASNNASTSNSPPRSHGATGRGDSQTGTNGSSSTQSTAGRPARGPAPTRGPPGPNANTGPGTQNIIAGAAAEGETTGPAIPSADGSSQPSSASIVASGPGAQNNQGNRSTPNAADGGRATPHSAIALRAALPPNLRNVPIVRDPNLRGTTVRVHYTYDAGGRVRGTEIRVGDNVQPRHIADHVNTVQALQRHQGLAGRVRLLLGKINAWIAGHPQIRPGSLAWETRREVEKLQAIVDARVRALDGANLTDAQRAELARELAAYEQQLTQHEANLRTVSNEPGRGYVAAEDTHDPASESLANPPADLGARIAEARSRAAQALAATPTGSPTTVAVDEGTPLRNGSSRNATHRMLTENNMIDSALETEHDHPAHGRDAQGLPGSQAASHAEQLVAVRAALNGQNEPIGVSRQQCGGCRAWFKGTAMRWGQTYVVADGRFIRVYYPNGQVAVYDGTVTTADPNSLPPLAATDDGTRVTYYDRQGNQYAQAVGDQVVDAPTAGGNGYRERLTVAVTLPNAGPIASITVTRHQTVRIDPTTNVAESPRVNGREASFRDQAGNEILNVQRNQQTVAVTAGPGYTVVAIPNGGHVVTDSHSNLVAEVDAEGGMRIYGQNSQGKPYRIAQGELARELPFTMHASDGTSTRVRPGAPPFAGARGYNNNPW